MTREELVKAIYDNGDMWSCPNNCGYGGNPLEINECMKCSEHQLTAYENSIREDERKKVLENFKYIAGMWSCGRHKYSSNKVTELKQWIKELEGEQ